MFVREVRSAPGSVATVQENLAVAGTAAKHCVAFAMGLLRVDGSPSTITPNFGKNHVLAHDEVSRGSLLFRKALGLVEAHGVALVASKAEAQTKRRPSRSGGAQGGYIEMQSSDAGIWMQAFSRCPRVLAVRHLPHRIMPSRVGSGVRA